MSKTKGMTESLARHDFGWHEVYCQEIVGIKDDGTKVECSQEANASYDGRYLCPKHLRAILDRRSREPLPLLPFWSDS